MLGLKYELGLDSAPIHCAGNAADISLPYSIIHGSVTLATSDVACNWCRYL
jgi:hypothetical protein